MTKPKPRKFLVVVEPAYPASSVGVGSMGMTYTQRPPTTVKVFSAVSASEAAEMANPPAGATVHVTGIAHVTKFKRPLHAKLEAA